jgi:rhodanese-related sulfurtransferase
MTASLFNRIKVNHLDADAFEKKISETADSVILDVRTEEEHSNTKIPNSILINIYESTFQQEILQLDKSKTYFVYCRSGSRSNYACEFMMKNGFEKVYNLEDGIVSWKGKIELGD